MKFFSNFFLLGFLLRVSLYILPCCFLFVKSVFSFFYIFFSHFWLASQPPYLSGRKFLFFLYISKANGEGGIWTLAPLSTTYSLSRGAPSASLGTSPKCPLFNIHYYRRLVQYSFTFFSFSSSLWHKALQKAKENGHRNCRMMTYSSLNGEGGIRTHAPLRTNGFQDRLVMTTSIPLHITFSLALNWAICILSQNPFTVNHYFHFF